MTHGHSPRRDVVLLAIPTLNEARTIIPVLERLTADPDGEFDLRICVVDGGSTDGTVELVRAYARHRSQVFLEHNGRRIQSAGINLAVARHGEGAKWLVRCDAHANYPRGYIASLLRTQRRTGATSVVVPMDSVGCIPFQKAVAWVSDSLIGSGGSAHRGGRKSGFVDHGHHALIALDMFKRVGGYEESFTHNEDAEFDCRLRALAGTIYLDGETRLEYHPRDSFQGIWRQYFNYGRGRSRTLRRHPTSLRLRQFAVPSFMVVFFACLAIAPALPHVLVVPFLYLFALALTSCQIALRHRTACGLLSGPVAGVMHTAWASGFLLGLAGARDMRWSPERQPAQAEAV